jgi:hypothetical protein
VSEIAYIRGSDGWHGPEDQRQLAYSLTTAMRRHLLFDEQTLTLLDAENNLRRRCFLASPDSLLRGEVSFVNWPAKIGTIGYDSGFTEGDYGLSVDVVDRRGDTALAYRYGANDGTGSLDDEGRRGAMFGYFVQLTPKTGEGEIPADSFDYKYGVHFPQIHDYDMYRAEYGQGNQDRSRGLLAIQELLTHGIPDPVAIEEALKIIQLVEDGSWSKVNDSEQVRQLLAGIENGINGSLFSLALVVDNDH